MFICITEPSFYVKEFIYTALALFNVDTNITQTYKEFCVHYLI